MGTKLLAARAFTPFVLRSVTPPLKETEGRTVVGVERLGKRIVIELEGELFLVIHLMISGRFVWDEGATIPRRPAGKNGVLGLLFERGSLAVAEFSTKKRASLTLVQGRAGLKAMDRGGLDVLSATPEAFVERLRSQNRTLKRALTDPTLFDGIGNAYSDEILHAARLSPLRLTSSLSDEEAKRLSDACKKTLNTWRDRLAVENSGFPIPKQVTAFRPEFAAHGKYGKPCPDCGAPIQRISYAENETNYCARCQNEGRLLADRGLSRLLKQDWPKTLDEIMAE